jgi:hypothetical protein
MKKEFKKGPRLEVRELIRPSYMNASYSVSRNVVGTNLLSGDDDDYFFEVEDY